MEKDQDYKMGRTSSEHIDDLMLKIEVSLDDMNPEFFGYIMDELYSLGVNDVYIQQVIMKKNRPGQILNILCQEEIKDKIIKFLFMETTTLGIRYAPYMVHRLERKFISVKTNWGNIDVKLGILSGEIVQISPEYTQCEVIARENKIPLKIVYDVAKEMGYQAVNKRNTDNLV